MIHLEPSKTHERKIQWESNDNLRFSAPGSPFLKEFEDLCKKLGLPHYFIYPRSPKQNSYVEISHVADEREFYQQGNCHSLLPVMQRKIQEWENTWNTVRPHAALNYLTPQEYTEKLKQGRLPTKDTIVLQA